MNKILQNAPMKQKLKMVIRNIILSFIAAVLITFIGSTLIKNNFQSFYETTYVKSGLVKDISENVQQIAKDVLYATNTDDEALTAERMENAAAGVEAVGTNAEALLGMLNSEDLTNRLKTSLSTFDQAKEHVLALASANQNTEALSSYDTEYAPALETLETVLAEIDEAIDAEARSKFLSSQYLALVVTIIVVLLTIGCIFLSNFLSNSLVKNITVPIAELETAAENISKGNLNITIEHSADDEMGHLAGAFRQTCENLQMVISDIKYMMEELKAGNFLVTSKCPEYYVGDFKGILTDLTAMISHLSMVLGQISTASDQVALGSSQLETSAQSLAEGATEQAGAVEELTATIENVTSEAQNSADYARSAFEKAAEYRRQANVGNQQMEELTSAMERINNASQEIENIIAEIEDIASQTNLLSLNASIEAARAGEAGRGFAVVADQIGKLAASSGESAVRTRDLIQKSLEEVSAGTQMAERTKGALEQIVEGVNVLADAAKHSSDTSAAQVATMEQVEQGIEQISGVVQSNSAAAQETSATSEELSAQAANLSELVGKFRL